MTRPNEREKKRKEKTQEKERQRKYDCGRTYKFLFSSHFSLRYIYFFSFTHTENDQLSSFVFCCFHRHFFSCFFFLLVTYPTPFFSRFLSFLSNIRTHTHAHALIHRHNLSLWTICWLCKDICTFSKRIDSSIYTYIQRCVRHVVSDYVLFLSLSLFVFFVSFLFIDSSLLLIA